MKDPIKRKTLALLKKLEKIFPVDNFMSKKIVLKREDYDPVALEILKSSKLIKETTHGKVEIPGEGILPLGGIKLTPLGVEFLNGLKQKQTNLLILILTLLTVILGGIQIYLAWPK